jgi:hypothetical protein
MREIYENMTAEDYYSALGPKVQETRNVQDLLPKESEFFVCLSSVSGIVGGCGPSYYNAS